MKYVIIVYNSTEYLARRRYCCGITMNLKTLVFGVKQTKTQIHIGGVS